MEYNPPQVGFQSNHPIDPQGHKEITSSSESRRRRRSAWEIDSCSCKQNNFTHFALITFYLQKTSFHARRSASLEESQTDTGNYPRFVELTNQPGYRDIKGSTEEEWYKEEPRLYLLLPLLQRFKSLLCVI